MLQVMILCNLVSGYQHLKAT